jgi:hypothetical protein
MDLRGRLVGHNGAQAAARGDEFDTRVVGACSGQGEDPRLEPVEDTHVDKVCERTRLQSESYGLGASDDPPTCSRVLDYLLGSDTHKYNIATAKGRGPDPCIREAV